ncbi:acyltransferase family protein [Plantibacter sp. YIM 135249]|uniref:acyltransferase family protein n=1 Tax=Plantibacter sp. YIM 135249 TaxID=3423918 RepID=UPI003D3572BA
MTRRSTPERPASSGVPVGRFQSLDAGLAGHRNSLGVIRLVLASAVIFSHAFPLGGWGEDPSLTLMRGQETVGGFAVVGFFAVSGYLIAKSGVRADLLQFLWRRVLRIFPAFWTVLLAGALIVGPIIWLITTGGIRGYALPLSGGPVGYMFWNGDLTMRQWGIHDIFATTTPYGRIAGASVLNGSLWTLAYEWFCYLLIAVLLVLGALRHARFVVPVLTAALVAIEVLSLNRPDLIASYLPFFADRFHITLTLAFLYGSCLAMYAKQIPLSNWLGVPAGVIAFTTLFTGSWVLVGYPAFAYFVFWLAVRLPARVQWIGAKNDYSYGMYVYGFLVQQVTAFFGWYRLGYLPWVLVTIVITAGCAWLSWHGVEKRAMALKDWGPGRGIRHWADRLRRRAPGAPLAS